MTVIGTNPRERTRYKSKMEEKYATYLRLLELGREIMNWWYEPVKFLIGSKKLPSGKTQGIYYTPDFMVQLPDYRVEFHETKGFRREAAMVRLAAAAEKYPHKFFLITGNGGKNGTTWTKTEV